MINPLARLPQSSSTAALHSVMKHSVPKTMSCPSYLLVLCSVVLLVNNARAFVMMVPRSSLTSSAPKLCGLTSTPTSTATVVRVTSMSASNGEDQEQLSRGAWAGKVLGAALTGVAAASQITNPAFAELGVGEGGLPDGARQFSNFLKVQKDWAELGKTVKEKGAGFTDEEWRNVAYFLRKVYQVGNDLEFLGGSLSGDKKKSAVNLVKQIQKEVQAADVPSRERNIDGFVAAMNSVEQKFETFSEMFQDVPSEL